MSRNISVKRHYRKTRNGRTLVKKHNRMLKVIKQVDIYRESNYPVSKDDPFIDVNNFDCYRVIFVENPDMKDIETNPKKYFYSEEDVFTFVTNEYSGIPFDYNTLFKGTPIIFEVTLTGKLQRDTAEGCVDPEDSNSFYFTKEDIKSIEFININRR